MASHVFDFYKKIEVQVHIFLYIVLCICITYVQKLPVSVQKYSANPLVRTVLFALILVLCKYVSFIHSLLFALFVLLYLSLTPGAGSSEGYETIKVVEGKKSKKAKDSCASNSDTPKHRWGDEIIFNERPRLLENDNVVTEQVQ